MVFVLKGMGNGSLELQAPALSVLSVTQVAFSGPFLEPEGKGDGVSVKRNEGVPVSLSEMVGNVLGDLGVHKGHHLLKGPMVVPDVGLHDGFPGVREKGCK